MCNACMQACSHLLKTINIELLSDVVDTIRVLESEVELVVCVEHLAAVLTGPRAPLAPARTEDVHVNVVTQVPRVLQPVVLKSKVGSAGREVDKRSSVLNLDRSVPLHITRYKAISSVPIIYNAKWNALRVFWGEFFC